MPAIIAIFICSPVLSPNHCPKCTPFSLAQHSLPICMSPHLYRHWHVPSPLFPLARLVACKPIYFSTCMSTHPLTRPFIVEPHPCTMPSYNPMATLHYPMATLPPPMALPIPTKTSIPFNEFTVTPLKRGTMPLALWIDNPFFIKWEGIPSKRGLKKNQ